MTIRQYIKNRETPLARLGYALYQKLRYLEFPAPKPIWKAVYQARIAVITVCSHLLQHCYYIPLFKSRCANTPRRMGLYDGMPLVMGNVTIEIGDDCRISGISTISGRSSAPETPRLVVGNNCDIGWQNQLSVGTRIVLGDNVRLAPRVMLAGYPGHPLDPADRARGMSDTDDQAGDIILEDDVWLATGTIVLAGVRIGAGTVVGANSTVTHDLPPMCLAAGSPAKVVKHLNDA